MMRNNWIAGLLCAFFLAACGTLAGPGEPAAGGEPGRTLAVAGGAPSPGAPLAPAPPVPLAEDESAAAAARVDAGPGAPEEAATDEAGPEAAAVAGGAVPPLAAAAAGSDRDIQFPAGGTRVGRAGMVLLRQHAARLKKDPKLVVTVIGHPDPLGSRSYNLALAEQRMNAVCAALRSLGVPKGQIRRVSAPRGTAAGACRTAACRPGLRRVELAYGQ